MTIFIGGAWPYANGSLHLGHIASLLPGDIIARYYRQKGEEVLYVSGTDCNGTPISIRARQEGTTPDKIADRYHTEFARDFQDLGFSYDCYTRTDSASHHQVVQNIFLKLLENGFIYKREVDQTYCETCDQFLPDRYVEGNCPHCGSMARGDQCDHCSAILDPAELRNKTCKLCGGTPVIKSTEHFYFALSKLQAAIEKYFLKAEEQKAWRENALGLTRRYLEEGLQDRAATRDLPNGVSVPLNGFEKKKIYVWIEAVSGYFSASKQWAEETGGSYEHFWNGAARTYYVHGKDNIPFHTIIWTGILMGIGMNALPEYIVSNEYLTVEQKKLSTSKNWAVWVPDVLGKYDPDSIRYFLTVNAPENRDTDFSWREFIYSHNSELLGAYGNLVNRTFKFIEKYFDGWISEGEINAGVKTEISALYAKVGNCIEKAHFKEGLEKVFSAIRSLNQYFDQKKPWKQITENEEECVEILRTCVFAIANLAQILEPFLPFSSKKVRKMLGEEELGWEVSKIYGKSIKLHDIHPLFERIDLARIEEEVERLNQNAACQ